MGKQLFPALLLENALRASSHVALWMSALILSGCCTTFQPYAVDPISRFDPGDRSLPMIAATPVVVTADYQVFESPDHAHRYRIPNRLQLSKTPEGRLQASSLEAGHGSRMILVANLAPPSTDGPEFYPVARLDIRPITESAPSTPFRVTTIAGSRDRAPFSAVVIVQVRDAQTIGGFKALLKTGAGFLLDAHFDVSIEGQGVRELTIPVSLDNAAITQQTM